jgi:hypothetical protein
VTERKGEPPHWLASGRARAILAGTLALLLLIELAARAYTYMLGGAIAAQARNYPAFDFVFASDDPWRFDPTRGFVGRPGLRFIIGSVGAGSNVSCSDLPTSLWPGDDLGPDWSRADLRIAFFGPDSAVEQPDWNRQPWPSVLSAALSRLSGRRVAVANYSRPGVGPVQAAMLAAEIAPAIGSDLVVLATSTGTLALDFVYRAVLSYEGTSIPLASSSPSLSDDPHLGVPVGNVVNPSVTKGWCNQMAIAARAGMTGISRLDGTLSQLRQQAAIASLLGQRSVATNWLSFKPALSQLARGRLPSFAAFKEVKRAPPRHLSDPDLGHDNRATRAMESLSSSGIPVVVVHSPIFPEVIERRLLLKYSGESQSYMATLLGSLEKLTERKVLWITDFLPDKDALHAEKLVNNPEGDWQLRQAGADLYADLAAQALLPIATALARER